MRGGVPDANKGVGGIGMRGRDNGNGVLIIGEGGGVTEYRWKR